MPILKPIAGHGSCVPVQKYLEKKNRALARDFLNFNDIPEPVLPGDPAMGPEVQWAEIMDNLRADEGNDKPWMGKEARTFKHIVLSPSPEDDINLDQLRELALAWTRKYFADYQVAIVYHDDNESHIPHAHIVVNNTNVVTGNRLQVDNPLELNRSLQDMAKERGFHALSNEMPEPKTGFARLARKNESALVRPVTLQEEYRSQAERRAENAEGYSWVADIRSRVNVAKNLARNEGEFSQILSMLGVEVMENSRNAKRQDWIFSFVDEPTKRVSGERLGTSYGRTAIERKLLRASDDHLSDKSSRELLRLARTAVELKNLGELSELAGALETRSRWNITSSDAAATMLAVQKSRLEDAPTESARNRIVSDIQRIERTRDFLRSRNVIPEHDPHGIDSDDGGTNWATESSGASWDAPEQSRSRDDRGGWNR